MKVLIIYDTKHGNTKKVAELIGEGLESVGENVITIGNVKEIDFNIDMTYDLILIGSPNHVGSHTKNVKKFIKNRPNSPLKGEKVKNREIALSECLRVLKANGIVVVIEWTKKQIEEEYKKYGYKIDFIDPKDYLKSNNISIETLSGDAVNIYFLRKKYKSIY